MPAVKSSAAARSVIELPKLNIQRMTIRLIGDSALITHRWSEKAKKEMLDKQMKKAKGAKAAKDPWMDFCEALYWLTPMPAKPTPEDIGAAKFGFPSIGFKACAVDACSHVDGITKVEARGAFHINGEFVEIQGTPEMREDMTRVGMGTADLRYRPQFLPWSAEFEVRFNANVLSAEQIVNLFNTGGFGIGVGEWRPQKDGPFGTFHVATQGE